MGIKVYIFTKGDAQRDIKENQRKYLTNYTSNFILIAISHNKTLYLKP